MPLKNLIKRIKQSMKARRLARAITTASFLAPLNVQAEEQETKPPISAKLDIDRVSKYIAYGFTNTEEFCIQPGISLTYKNPRESFFKDLTIGGWFNFNTETEKLDEADLHVLTSLPLGNNFSGFLEYWIFSSPTNLFETSHAPGAYISAVNLPLKPSVYLSRNVTFPGTHAEFSLSQSILKSKNKKTDLSAKLSLAYNDHYFRENSGLGYARGDILFSTSLTDNLALRMGLSGILSLDEPFKDQLLYKIGLSLVF